VTPESYAEARPEMGELTRQVRRPDPDQVSLRKGPAALAERAATARQPTATRSCGRRGMLSQWEDVCSRFVLGAELAIGS
jgi:hypothetical protein